MSTAVGPSVSSALTGRNSHGPRPSGRARATRHRARTSGQPPHCSSMVVLSGAVTGSSYFSATCANRTA